MDIAHGVRFPLLGPVITSGKAHPPGPFSTGWPPCRSFSRGRPRRATLFFELHGRGDRSGCSGTGCGGRSAKRRPRSPRCCWRSRRGARCSRTASGTRTHSWSSRALALLAVLKLRERPDSAWAAVLPSACLVLPHLHSSAPVVWLALVPLAWGTVRRWNRRWLALGFAAGGVALHPARDPRGAAPASATRARSSPRRVGRPRSARRGTEPLLPAEPDLRPPLPDPGRHVPRAVRLLGRPERAGRVARALARQPRPPVSPAAPARPARVGRAAVAGRRGHHPRGARPRAGAVTAPSATPAPRAPPAALNRCARSPSRRWSPWSPTSALLRGHGQAGVRPLRDAGAAVRVRRVRRRRARRVRRSPPPGGHAGARRDRLRGRHRGDARRSRGGSTRRNGLAIHRAVAAPRAGRLRGAGARPSRPAPPASTSVSWE